MTAVAIPATAATALDDVDQYDLPERTVSGPVCGGCTDNGRNHGRPEQVRHATAAHIRLCHDRVEEWAREAAAEIYAEGAWLRAAEAGSPDTWADEERERQIEALGYGPPPGY